MLISVASGKGGTGKTTVAVNLALSLNNVQIVTEPTLSGIHDMERVAQVSKHFSVPTKVVINKFDINPENSEDIKKICQKEGIEVMAQLPFSQKVSESIVQGIPLVEFSRDGIAGDIATLWERIK